MALRIDFKLGKNSSLQKGLTGKKQFMTPLLLELECGIFFSSYIIWAL